MNHRNGLTKGHHHGAARIPLLVALGILAWACTIHAQTTWDWDFGDGSAHSDAQNPTHAYATSGTYHVVMTATVDGQPCTKEGDVTVNVASGVTISNINSKTSKPGSAATIYGSGFSADRKKDIVYFGATKAKISKAKTTSIKVKIPKGAKGIVQVYVVVDGQESNRVDFTIK